MNRSSLHSRLAIALCSCALASQAAARQLPDRTPILSGDAPTLWVDGSHGSDANDGRTRGSALATIQAAANLAAPGDTVGILRGIYREVVTPPADGTEGSPIVFRAEGPGRVVLSGGDSVTGWTAVGNDVWRATVVGDANGLRENNTVFVNGELAYEARQFAENDPLDMDDWGQLPQTGLLLRRLRAPDLVGFGDDVWNGGKVTFHVNDWTITTRDIVDYHSGPGRIIFDPPITGSLLKQTVGFYIHDTMHALDRPGEWFKAKDADVLYYHAEPGQDPASLRIEFKRRGYAFDLRGRSHVTLKGLVFRGTTLQLDAGNACNVIEGNVFYGFGKGSGSGFDRMSLSGTGNSFRDNEVYQSFHTALDVYGSGNSVVNNEFHDIAIQTGRMAINASQSTDTLISHNTFRKLGRSVLDGYPVRSEIAFNLIEDLGRISWDTGAFDSDGQNGNSSFSIFHHNVLRGTDARGILEGFYGRNDNAVIHHNVFYDWVSGVPRPTLSARGIDFRQAYHNTMIGPVGPGGNTSARNAVQTRYNNNLQINTTEMAAIGVDMRGNHDYVAADFEGFNTGDYRLAGGSGAIDAGIPIRGINDGFVGGAPDAGALELGQDLWPVGHDFDQPHRPTLHWRPLPGTNLFTNAYFSQGMDAWTVVSGAPYATDHNSWNMGASSLTGTFRTESIELLPGSEIELAFDELQPLTTYTLGCGVRLINEVARGDQYSASSAPVQAGEVRGGDFVTGITDGGWVRYSNIDFGAHGRFDTLELLLNTGTDGVDVDGVRAVVRLGDQNGPVLFDHSDLAPSVDTVSRTWRRHIRSTLPSIQGLQTLHVTVTGAKAPNLAIGYIRLLDSSLDASDLLTAKIAHGPTATTGQVGAPDWLDVYETIQFTTPAGVTSAAVSFANLGQLNGYLDRMFLTEGSVEFGNTNIAETDGFASQSTTEGTASAALALDANPATAARTQDAPNSWWQTRFFQRINPGRVELVNAANAAANELGNFTVTVWDGDPANGGQITWQQSFLPSSGVLPGETFTIEGDALSTDGFTRLASAIGTVIRVQLNGQNPAGTGRLALAEVRVLTGEDVDLPANVARTGVAEQSSDNSLQSDRGPHRALDGYINPLDGFTSTLATGNDWWQVDLGQAPTIDQIRLFNRGGSVGDRLRNFRVSVWSGDPRHGGVERWGREYPGTVPQGGSAVFNANALGSGGNRLDSVVDGTFVRVRLNGTNYLSFTEVQVWAR